MSRIKNLYTDLITNRRAEVDGWLAEYLAFSSDVAKVSAALKEGKEIESKATYEATSFKAENDPWPAFAKHLLCMKYNGVASCGQSILSKENFPQFIGETDFVQALAGLIKQPNKENFVKFWEAWERTRQKFGANRNPLLVNRTLAACTRNVTSAAYGASFESVYGWLVRKGLIPQLPDPEADWYDKNVQVMTYLRESFAEELRNGETNEHLLSIFVWQLFRNISNPFTLKKQVEITDLAKTIITVRELLADSNLTIPQYQRPYKWTGKNINQLFTDIATNIDKSSYRLGTIVFHQDGDRKNIVDGQQRTISLLLATRALIKLRKDDLDRKDLKEQLTALEKEMVNPSFKSAISKANIHNNYLEISRIVGRSDFTEEHIDFLLNKCAVVTFSLNDVSEAFQFFDSQNARGRDLEPHDLLKAFHLREFSAGDEPFKVRTVGRWENSETEELTALFSQYLYRIRNWSKGASARYFGKEDTALFKGVNLETVARYPYVEQLRMAHHFVDHYNGQYERRIDGRALGFPFHLDQIIINGRRFFEMTSHYQETVALFNDRSAPSSQFLASEKLDRVAVRIMETINTYEGRSRTGDRYVRTIYDCLLIYYIDKFGRVEISGPLRRFSSGPTACD